MAGRRACKVVAEAVEPDVTDSVGTSGTEPQTTESADLSVAELPAESLYLPSEIPRRMGYPIGDDLSGQWPVQRRRGPPIDFHRAPGL